MADLTPLDPPATVEATVIVAEEIQDAPTEPDKLAQDWAKRIDQARKHWKKFFQRCEHNRKLVNGFDWKEEITSDGFIPLRANLIGASIDAVLPNLYARSPELSVVPVRKADADSGNLAKFTDTLTTVLNTYLERAKIKSRGKGVVRSALTCSYGILKIVYQRDIEVDPIIQDRLQDAQDNLAHIDGLLSRLSDDDLDREALEVKRLQLEQTIEGLKRDAEAKRVDGLVIDRVLTDQLIIDPSVVEFDDYVQADWMAQLIPMRRGTVEEVYKIKIPTAVVYDTSLEQPFSAEAHSISLSPNEEDSGSSEDDQVCVIEIWDRLSQRVYTMVDGCKYFIREPYSPAKVGARWYPFFLLTYKKTDGRFISESIVDLMEKLQTEHNETREKFVKHRDLIRPGYIASSDVSGKTIKNFTDSVMGEVTVLDNADGVDVRSLIQPKTFPPIDPTVYDTSVIRQDIEQTTGLQDAMRSTVVTPKTATEAQILQQSLSGRVQSFRDDVEDYLQEVGQYVAQVLLRELTEQDVAKIVGDPIVEVDPMTGIPAVVSKPYEWPTLQTEEIMSLIKVKITAGSTGSPDKLTLQENWKNVLPSLQGLLQTLYQIKAQGIDSTPIETLLKETVRRFDDRIDSALLIPDIQPPAQNPQTGIDPANAMAMIQDMVNGQGGQGAPAQPEASGEPVASPRLTPDL